MEHVTHTQLLWVAVVVFLLAAIWPAFPPSAQGLRINLTAVGLLVATLAALVAFSGR